MDRLMPFLATQIWYLPYLALFILGVVFALGRRDMGNGSQYAVFGFGLMILGLMLSSANTYFMIARAGGDYDMSAVARNAALFHMGTIVLNLGGWGFILAAIFAKRPPPPSRVE